MGMGPVRDGAAAGRGEFEHDAKPAQIAYELRVSTKSVYQWRRRPGGRAERSVGCLSAQLARLRVAMKRGLTA